MALQHLRSNTASKRPTPASMAEGQLAINTNATSPGLFFKDAGGALIKIGPVHIGTSAPNGSPAGSSGNAIGELWLDTSGGNYTLKIWDGSDWRSSTGAFVDAAGDTMTGALILPSGTAAAPSLGVGSTDNGIYSPGTDQVAIATNGTARVFVDASGRCGVGITPTTNTRLDVSGTYVSNVATVSALDIDCSAGNYFIKTINANSTFTFSNVASSRAVAFTLELTHTSGTVTWPTSVKWPSDTAPTLTTGKTHLFTFVTDDGGTRWRGAALVDYVN